jgi:hypothetical protein
MSAWKPRFQLVTSSDDHPDPLFEALAVKPPWSEMRSLRSTVSGMSIHAFWLAGDDSAGRPGKTGAAGSTPAPASARRFESVGNSGELPIPIESELAGSVA